MTTEEIKETIAETEKTAEEVKQKNQEALNRLAENVCLFNMQADEFRAEIADEYMTECLKACEKGKLDKIIEMAEHTLDTSKNVEQRLAAHAIKELAQQEDGEGIAKMLETGNDFDDNLKK